MAKSNKSPKEIRNFSLDLNDWCHEINDDDVAIFEKYTVTQKRASDLLEETDDEESQDQSVLGDKTIAVYQTPWGPVKFPEFCDINKYFKLWTMYTKNPIGKNLTNTINRLSGVETLEILTPYRARIGICPLYKDGQVLTNIVTAIKNNQNGVENIKT